MMHTAALSGSRLPHGGPFLGAGGHFSWDDPSLLTVPKASLLTGPYLLRRDLVSLAQHRLESVQVWTVCLGGRAVSQLLRAGPHLDLAAQVGDCPPPPCSCLSLGFYSAGA